MVENVKKISNPLTIIAIFAALAEVNATVVLGLLDESVQPVFIWFIMIFPILLVLCFFGTLVFKNRVMYSPSDYKNDESFLNTLKDNYGSNGTDNDFIHSNELSNIFVDFEKKILEKISLQLDITRKQIANMSPDDLEVITKDMEKVTSESINEFKKEFFDINKMRDLFVNFPAHYVLLFAIIKSKSKNIRDLKRFSDNFFIPIGWEEGVNHFIQMKILLGTNSSFIINPDCRELITRIIKENHDKILKLSQVFKDEECGGVNNIEHKRKYKDEIEEINRTMKFL